MHNIVDVPSQRWSLEKRWYSCSVSRKAFYYVLHFLAAHQHDPFPIYLYGYVVRNKSILCRFLWHITIDILIFCIMITVTFLKKMQMEMNRKRPLTSLCCIMDDISFSFLWAYYRLSCGQGLFQLHMWNRCTGTCLYSVAWPFIEIHLTEMTMDR